MEFNWENVNCKLIKGDFSENSFVEVLIEGKYKKRKVYYNKRDGLYILYQGYKFFYNDFC